MNRLLNTFRTAAILIAGGLAAILLFTLLGSVLVAVGIFVIVAAVAGGLHFLIFGRSRLRGFQAEFRQEFQRDFQDAQRSPGGYDMIDVTPPREPRRPH
ncbi:MAG: hypothetical protein H2042_15350 [Rhizobiales bacterium]|nr:hypothetical protein [Hyphomicrobiales bacterium]